MTEKSKFKQFLCGLVGHGLTSSKISDEKETKGYHSYCYRCGKTLSLWMNDNLSETDKQFILRKI